MDIFASAANPRLVQEFVAAIDGAWGKTAAALVKAGGHVVEGRAKLPRDLYKVLLKKVACGESTAKKLACIGGKSIFGSFMNRLPPHLVTLYVLSQLDDETLAAAFADGRIHPGMSVKNANALRNKDTIKEDDPPPSPAPKPEPPIDFAAAWDAAMCTEDGRAQITAKFDQVGRAGLCAVISDRLRIEFQEHASAAAALGDPRTSDANAKAEIARLARECSASLTHPEQHVDEIRKKLARIKKLAGFEEPQRKPAAKSNDKLDFSALSRALTLGRAGPPGQKFPAITIKPNGVDAEGNSAFGEPPDQGSRH